MKKLLYLVAAVSLFSACTALEGLYNGSVTDSPVKVSPTITKVAETSFDFNDAIGLTVIRGTGVWAENEKLTYDGNSFSGDLNWYHGEDACVLKAYYPYSESVPTSFTVALDQSNGNSTSDFVAAIKEGVTPTAEAVPMLFSHKLSRIIFNVINRSNNRVDGVYLCGSVPTATISEDFEVAAASVQAADIVAYKASDNQYRLITVPQTGSFTVKVSAGGAEMTQELASVELKSGKEYRVNVVVEDVDILVVITGEINNWNDGGELVAKDQTGPEYVDLGLPSGLLWATVNVGADNPWEIGDRYAWGELTTKDWYDWDNYKWCDGSETSMTKYCSDSYYGIVDGKTVLDDADDVARLVYGGGWRMPSYEEAYELYSNCTWTQETFNGVDGYRATAANGNSLFFPLNGQYDENGISCTDYEFEIWTTRCNEDYWAYRLCNYGVSLSNHKHDGLCIRAVKSATGEPETGESDPVNLSQNGTANCYMVNAAGQYSFDATVKGNSLNSVGSPVKAAVLWETFNNDEQPAVGDIVKDVSLSNGRVCFNATGHHGNASIAVLDASENILWSWHIWVTDYVPVEEYDVYVGHESTPMMNRNLGALSKTPGAPTTLGFYYQWGRKDPFPSSSSITSFIQMETCPAEVFSTVSSSSSIGTIDYSIQHPTHAIVEQVSSHDWLYSPDSSLWSEEKTMYDPCPAGWKIPDHSLFGGFVSSSNSFSRDTDNRGVIFNSNVSSPATFYPAAGTMPGGGLNVDEFAESCHYWTSSVSSSTASKRFCVYNTSSPSTSYLSFRSHGFPVRCCKESQ